MATIEMKNIGPIKEAKFDLNKVNVFMGPQSSGKSTLAKIISYCTWVEKDVATCQSLEAYENNNDYFKEHLENFHKIKGYFSTDSYIYYRSDIVEITWKNQQCSMDWVDQYAYKRSKIAYIPAERNMIILPEVEKVEFGNVNVRSFLFDWLDARKNYPKDKKLPILNLNVDYYHVNGIAKEDHIRGKIGDKEYDILLSNASSGVQSVTPLITMIDYLTDWVYKEEKTSFIIEEKRKDATKKLIFNMIYKPYFKYDNEPAYDELVEYVKIVNSKVKEDKELIMLVDKYDKVRTNLFITQNSQFIIEEPEQNLFPETQRDLVYYLLEKCLKRDDNRLTITTHSPYILYALNNCMMGGLIYDKMNDPDKERLKCKSALINPQNVSAYEIHDGVLKEIQQTDGLIGANYFDIKMKELMDDFYVMLNYYGE